MVVYLLQRRIIMTSFFIDNLPYFFLISFFYGIDVTRIIIIIIFGVRIIISVAGHIISVF